MNIKQLETINLLEALVKDQLRELDHQVLLRFYDELKIHIKELVIDRGLNKYLGNWIALAYIVLIADGKEGLTRIKKYMSNFDLSEEESRLILKGIFIDEALFVRGYYSELLKDAIALTKDALGDILSVEGEIRKNYALLSTPTVEWAMNHKVYTIVPKIKSLLDNPFTMEAVHGIRITLRKVMVLLDLMWFYDCLSDDDYQVFKTPIKEFFYCFKQSRELDVLYDQLKGLDDNFDQHVYHRLEFSRLRLRRQIAVFDGKELINHIKKIVDKFNEIDWQQFDVYRLLNNYEEALEQVKDQNVFNQFRVMNKRYKYLYSLGIISFESCFKENIHEIHDLIETLHDIRVNKAMTIRWRDNNKIEADVNYDKILDYLETSVNEINQSLDVLMFKSKKCMNIVGVRNGKKNM